MGSKSIENVWSESAMNEYISKYRELCLDLNEGVSKEDIRKHNSAMKKLSKLFYQLKNQEDKKFVLELLYDDNIQIASLVASHCLGWKVYDREAIKVLKSISKNKSNSVVAFNAKMTLEVYNSQGYLDF